jgi:hypothetical protein
MMLGMKPDDPRHGTANGYDNLGCRCPPCTSAWADYIHERRMARNDNARLRRKYRQARDAGYSTVEAQKRKHWADPLAKGGETATVRT